MTLGSYMLHNIPNVIGARYKVINILINWHPVPENRLKVKKLPILSK